jgi:hypothetical protein
MAAPFVNVPFMAGARFGLSAKDLAEKYGLDEDTSEGIVQEFGATEPARMRTATYKGRGGNVLGYQTGGRPTVEETVFEGLPLAINMPKTPKAPETPKTPQEADKLYRGVAQGINIYEQSGHYGVGFGQGDLRRALQEGYTEESIKDYLSDYYQGSIGPVAAEKLGISPRTSNLTRTQPTPRMPTQTQKDYAGVAGGVNIFQPDAYGVGFGAGDLRRAQEAGYSPESIKKFLQGADIQIGEKARAALGM